MILTSLVENKGKNLKSLSVLIDPDKIENKSSFLALLNLCKNLQIDYILVGGSLLVKNTLKETLEFIKETTDIPAILFPGSNQHIEKAADAILFLSLISGRNPDLLIGQHVVAAPVLKNSKLEILSTGYILVGDNANTTVAYISQTSPIPINKSDIAVCTAMAGEMIGMKLIYLDAGSGAEKEVSPVMIEAVNKSVSLPLIVGGGINKASKAESAYNSGADMLVLGTAVEKNVDFISEVVAIRDKINSKHS